MRNTPQRSSTEDCPPRPSALDDFTCVALVAKSAALSAGFSGLATALDELIADDLRAAPTSTSAKEKDEY